MLSGEICYNKDMLYNRGAEASKPVGNQTWSAAHAQIRTRSVSLICRCCHRCLAVNKPHYSSQVASLSSVIKRDCWICRDSRRSRSDSRV